MKKLAAVESARDFAIRLTDVFCEYDADGQLDTGIDAVAALIEADRSAIASEALKVRMADAPYLERIVECVRQLRLDENSWPKEEAIYEAVDALDEAREKRQGAQ